MRNKKIRSMPTMPSAYSAFTKACGRNSSSSLAEENGNLPQIEVNEVLGLVCHIRAKVSSHNCVPCWIVLFVELLLDEGSNIFLDIVLLQGLSSAVNGILLHVLCHVSIFDHSLTITHCWPEQALQKAIGVAHAQCDHSKTGTL